MRKERMVIIATVVLIVATAAVFLYVRQYYMSMHDAKPVMQFLERATPGDLDAAARTLVDGPRLKEPGAGTVRRAVLRALANTSDEKRLHFLLVIILAGEDDGNLLFKRKDEWKIIQAATERYNLKPWQKANLRFFVTTNSDGFSVLSVGSRNPMP